jgi:mannose-6-phosphate isomerase-like protein (cupin superfamily)
MNKLWLITIAFTLTINAAQVIDLYGPKDISTIKKQLVAEKKAGFASVDLKQYGNHHTMLAYREATGSSEVHEHEADLFVVEEGDAMIVTGGKLIGGHLTKAGELRGTSVEGGEKHALKTGDIIHIPAGVPHQILVTPGKPITYFVVKVAGQ